MKRLIPFGLWGVLLWSTAAFAQSSTPAEDDQEEISPQTQAPVEQQSDSWKGERQALLQVLTREIEPNLPSQDVERLKRNVQRRGSYRADWAQSSFDLLVANAPVAELQIYRYSEYRNPRLNLKLLQTLLAFESLRYPRAAVAFAEMLGVDATTKRLTLDLMAKAVNQDQSIAMDAVRLLDAPWMQDVTVEDKLHFLQQSCSAWKRGDPAVADLTNRLANQSQQFWGQLFAQEVRMCLKGL